MIWAVAVAVLMLGLIAVLNGFFPGVLGEERSQMSLTHNILLLMLLSSSLVLGYHGRGSTALKHALAWIGVALLLVLGYSYRDDLLSIVGRLGGDLVPARPTVTTAGNVEIRASNDGHFQVNASINDAAVRLLVDTGATITSLSPEDAERIGFDLNALNFDRPVDTANGRTYVASVRLNSLDIGPISLADVGASVHQDGLDHSLLGMNVLDRLSGFERSGDRLILKP